MATINAATLKGKPLKNGNYKVYISIAHKGMTRFIVTDVEINSPSKLRNNKVINQANAEFLNLKLSSTIRRYEQALINIDISRYSCDEIVAILKNAKGSKSPTLKSELDEYIESLSRPKSIKLYTLAIRSFIDYMGGDVPMTSITPNNIQGFNNALQKRGLSTTTINIYTTLLKIIIDNSIKLKHVRYEVHPFEVYKKPQANVRDIDISVSELRKIRDLDIEQYNLRIVRDIFMLSYYLAGINLTDLLNYNFKNKNQIKYVRTKTAHTKTGNNQTCFTIQPEADVIIRKYITSSGRLVFGKYNTRSKIDNLLFRQIGNLATAANINKRIIYYTARKSFVQHGFELGISLETLEYCIGQSMKRNRPIFNYVRIMSKHADTAIRMILDNLKKED